MGKKFNSGLDKMINESVQQGEVDPQTGLEQVKPLKGKSLDDIIAENSDQSLQVDMSRTVGAEQLASGLTEEEWDFHDHAKARKRRAEEQGVLEQTGNVLARIVPKIAYGVIEQAGYLFDLEAHVDTVTGVGNDYSNFLTEWGQSGKKAMDEAFPIYRENPNSTFDLTDSGWWFENGEGLVESISEFMVTGAGVGKMFGGAARLIGQTMKSSAKMGGILTGTAELLTAAELAYVEGAMSGAEVYNEIYEIARAQGKSIEESKAQASKAAGTTVRLNTVINTALNASSAKMFVRPKGAASKLDASYKRGPNESMSAWRERLVNEASENGTKSGFATALAEAPKESLEEIVNEVASAVGKFKGRQAIGDLTIEDNETLFGEILETLGSDQTALAAILGGFGGLGQTALTSITPNAKERRRQEEDYRKRQLGYVVERVDSFQESQKKMAEALKNNDDAAYREATDEMFLSEAYSSIINGAEDHLSTLYDEIEQLSPEEAQKQGYDIDPDSPDYYKKRAKKAKEDIKKLSKDYANILSKYNSYDSEAAEVGYGEAVFLKHAHKNSIENKINDAQENLNNAKLRHAKDQELRGTDMDVMQAMETQDKIKASEKSIDDAIKELSKVEKRDGRSGRKQLERKYGKPPKGTTQKQHAINKINERIERIKKDREKNIDLLENQRKEFDSDEDFVQALKENTAARESIIAEQSAIDSARQYLKDLDKEYREFTSKEGRDKFVKEGQNELDKQRAEQRKNEEEAKAEQRRLKEEAKRAKAAAKAAKKAKKEAAKKGSDTDGKGVGAEPTSTEEGAGESVPSKAGDDSEIDEEKSGEEIIGEDNEEGDGDGSTEDVVEEGIGKSELSKPPIPSEDGDIANPTSGQSKKAYETKEATSTSERLVIPAGASFAYLSKEYVEVGGLKRTIGTKKADNLEKELESSKQFLPNQELTLEVDTNYTWKDKDGEIKSFDDFVNKDGSIDIENAPIAIKRDGKTIAHVRTKDWILAKKDGLYANVADSLDSKDPLYQNAERQAIINKEIRKKVFKSYLDGKGPLKTKVSKKSPGVLSINKVDGKVVRDTMSTLTPKQNTLLIVKNGNLHKSKSNIYTGEKGSSLLNTDEFLGSLSNYEGLVMAPFVAANGDVMIAPVAIPTLTDSQVDTMISVLEDPEAHKTAIFQDTGYDVSTPKGMLSFLRLFTHVTDSSAQEFGEAVNADGPASKMHFNYSTKTGKLAIAKHNREVKIINLKDVKGSRDAIKEILSKKLFSVRLSAINTSGNVVEPIIKDGKYDSKGYENYNEYAKSYLVTDIKGNEISDTEESYFDQPVIEYSDNFESEESTGKGAKAQPGGKPAKSEPATDTTADVEAKRLKELNDKLKPLKTKAESIVGNTPMDKLEKGDIQKEIKSIESEINSSPPVKIPDSLQGLVVTTPIHGKEQTVFTTQSLDRNVVFVQIDGKRYGFYQSTKGTDNKIKNHWYPFYGKANGWVVKDGGGKNWKYNSEASPELQNKLKDAADKLNKEYGKEQFKDTPYIHDTSEAEANELIGSQIKNAKEELFSGNKKAYDEVRKKTAEDGFKQPSRPALEAEPTTDTTTNVKKSVSEVFNKNPELAKIGTVEQYSEYLDSVFPNSKVKDIVYHGANEPIETGEFIKKTGATGNAIWFSGSKKYATDVMNRPPQSESLMGRKLRGAPTMYSVLLNIKNPAHFYESTGAILGQSPEKFIEGKVEEHRLHGNKQYDKNVNDGALFHHPNSKKPETSDSAEQVVVFEPEQIHMLGSKKDIDGFKKFVGKTDTTTDIEEFLEETDHRPDSLDSIADRIGEDRLVVAQAIKNLVESDYFLKAYPRQDNAFGVAVHQIKVESRESGMGRMLQDNFPKELAKLKEPKADTTTKPTQLTVEEAKSLVNDSSVFGVAVRGIKSKNRPGKPGELMTNDWDGLSHYAGGDNIISQVSINKDTGEQVAVVKGNSGDYYITSTVGGYYGKAGRREGFTIAVNIGKDLNNLYLPDGMLKVFHNNVVKNALNQIGKPDSNGNYSIDAFVKNGKKVGEAVKRGWDNIVEKYTPKSKPTTDTTTEGEGTTKTDATLASKPTEVQAKIRKATEAIKSDTSGSFETWSSSLDHPDFPELKGLKWLDAQGAPLKNAFGNDLNFKGDLRDYIKQKYENEAKGAPKIDVEAENKKAAIRKLEEEREERKDAYDRNPDITYQKVNNINISSSNIEKLKVIGKVGGKVVLESRFSKAGSALAPRKRRNVDRVEDAIKSILSGRSHTNQSAELVKTMKSELNLDLEFELGTEVDFEIAYDKIDADIDARIAEIEGKPKKDTTSSDSAQVEKVKTNVGDGQSVTVIKKAFTSDQMTEHKDKVNKHIAELSKIGQNMGFGAKHAAIAFGPLDYTYGGLRGRSHTAREIPSWLEELSRDVEVKLGKPKGYYNHVLINRYQDSKGIGAHTDAESIYVDDKGFVGSVAIYSIGDTKTPHQLGNLNKTFKADSGSIIEMSTGKMRHNAPGAKGVRYSINFRHIPDNRLKKQKDKEQQEKDNDILGNIDSILDLNPIFYDHDSGELTSKTIVDNSPHDFEMNDEKKEMLKKGLESILVRDQGTGELYNSFKQGQVVDSVLELVVRGLQSKKSIQDSFNQAKAMFEQRKALYEAAERQFDRLSEEDKEKLAVTDLSDAQMFTDEFGKVLNNWEAFSDFTKQKLVNIFGIKKTLSDTQEEKKKDDDEAIEGFDEIESLLEKVSFDDGATFQTNHKDTASARFKLFLALRTAPKRTFLNLRAFIPFDTVYDDMQMILAGVKPDYDSFISELAIESAKKPYLKNILEELDKQSQQVKNEFVSAFSKQYNPFIVTLWGRKKTDNGTVLQMDNIESNRNDVIKRFEAQWVERQKISPIVKMSKGNLIINPEKAKEFEELRQSAIEDKTEGLNFKIDTARKLLDMIGVDMPPNSLEHIFENSDKIFKMSPTNMFKTGMFKHISKALNGNNTDDSGVESPLGLNNPLTGTNKEGSSIRKLASIASKFTDSVHSNSHRDSEGKTIYSYSLPSHLSHTLRRLKEQDGNNSKTEGLSKISFSKSSSWLDALKNDDKFRDTFSVSYLDGLNQRYSNQKGIKRGRQSEREMELQSIALFQNNGNDAAHFVYPTISDKTTTPIVTALKHDMQVMIDKDTGKMTFGRDTKRAIENLIRAEIDRIENHKTTTPKEGGILGYHFDKRGNTKQAGAKKMLLFPELNDLLTEDAFTSDGKILTSVQEQMFNKVESNLKSLAKETLKSWQELGIVTDNNLMFDASYRAKLATKVGGGIARQAAFAALDMELNYMIANLNTMQLISGDPALYFKNNAENTMVQYTKRLAKDIAPGMDGNFKNRKFNVAFAKDKDTVSQHIENYKKVIGEKASAYEGLEGTDAQELTTVQEHLTVMYAYGKLSDEDYTRLMEKADNEEDFDGKDLDTILQPQKPVFVNDEFNFELDVNKMTYIKSSSFPLLPQFTEGLELDAIRKDMLENGVDRLVYVSGAKLGATKIADIWDGNSIKKDFSLKENITTLDRDGFRIQQEVPYKEDKKKILTISQMNKLLFEGILDIKGMSELKARKDEIRIKLFEMGKDKLFKKLGIEVNEDTGEFSFKDLSKVQEALIEEAKSRNYPINDIQGLELTENKKGFILPLGFNASSKKFESILMSLVTNNVIKQKISGKSYVQGSSAGMLTGASKSKKWSELTDKDLGGIVFTQNADLDNGLKFARRNEETGATEAAQMIVPFYFRDKNGKPLKMSKYTKKVDGKTIIDPDKMDADLLKLVGARIPNQGHSSMLPIEIVGFLPESMGDLVIVPDEITAQMGSDFDVDKLYVYQYNYKRNKAGKLERVKHAVKQVKKEKVKFKKPVIKKEEEYISKSTKERIEESFGEDSYLMRTIKNNNGELTQSLASRIEMMLSNALDAYEANEQYTDISTGITFQSKELKLFINKLTDVYENTPVSAEEDFGYGIREKVKLPSGKVTLETQGRTITLNEQQTNAYVDMLDWHNNIDASEKTEITIQTSKGPKSYKANAYVLEGYAGTGKTTIIKKFLESVDPNLDNVSATAPTHKAKLQVKKTTGVKVYTVHKLLGLRPDTSVDNFSLATARFDQQNKPKIGDTDYVVIDEASMLNKELFNLVIGLASKYNTKIIFMGDPAQLPPIGERRSLVFDKVKEKSILSKVERQEKDNPLGKVYDAIRTNVNSPVDMFPHTDNIKDGKGIEFKRSRTEFEKEFGEALVKDPENVRAISYTNKAVRSYNKLARKYMFPVKEGAKSYKNFPFLPKEQLMFYGNIFYNRATGDYEYTNSEDVVVKSIERLEKDGYVGTSLTFETSPDKDFPGRPVFVLDDTEKNRRKFQKEVVELTDKKEKAYAISAKQGNIANAKLERFRDEHLVTWDVTHPTKKSYGKPFLVSEKKIDYGYALTSHKSQGSTFKEVFIDEADINSVPANPVDINKSKYVALSRPTDKATVMTNLPENAPVGKPDPNFKAPPAPTVKYRGGKPAEGSEQEAYPKQTSLIERGKAIGKEPTGKTTDNDPKEFVNHSGGAKGGDTAWDKIGREFGVVNHKHYREPGATKLDSPELKDAKPVNISKEDYEEGQEKATVAARQMGRIGNNQQVRSDYMIRNWAQVKYSDAVYAVGTIIDKGSVMKYDKVAQIPQVKGGTGYAVQMAINEGKPVYVYDGTKDSWFTWDGNNFSTTDTPTLTKNFAGIGSRSLSSDEVWKKSDQAIRDAYGKTFGEEAQTSLEEEFEKINEEGAEFTEEVDETLESLQNEYIDIHWDVLTHPEVLPRVLAPLDKRGEYSIDSEAKLINGIKSKNKTTKTPLYRRTQSEAFIQNRGGKSGVGQFSLASTFNSTIQSEDLRLGTMTKEGEQPIYISVFEGYQLRRLSGKGNNKNGDKASNIQDMQNASVDNANEQTLDKINLNDSTFLAANAIAQLEDDKGKNVTIQHISRLLSQKVIHDYVKELQLVSDSTVEGPAMTSEQKKSKAYANIREKYKEKSKGARATNTQLSPKNMLEMIKQEGSPTNEWFANQIVALDAFMNFDEVGHILTNIQSALNTDSKGVSPTYFQVEDKIHKVEKVPNNPMVRGTESLFGNDKEAGRATELGPYLAKNIASRFLPQGSRVIRESINTIMDYTFKDVLTVDQRQKIFDEFKAFAFASEHVFNVDPVKERKRLLLGGKEVRLPLDYGNNKKLVLSGDKTITSRNKNITSLKPGESGIQYVDGKTFKVTYHGELKHSQVKDKTGVDYSTGEAFAKTTKGEPTEDKTKKFIAGEGTKHIYQFEESTKEVNMSLARRVRAAQESWGANNFLLARINPKFAEIEGGADTLSYVASAGERLDESEATKGFIDLLTSDVAEERQLGEDLVKFSFLTSGTQGANNFIKFVPNKYLEIMGVSSQLRSFPWWDADMVDVGTFAEQFIRHNPYFAPGISEDVERYIQGNRIIVNTDPEAENNPFAEYMKLEINPSSGESDISMARFIQRRKDNQTELYEYFPTEQAYIKINTLGDRGGYSEYSSTSNIYDLNESVFNKTDVTSTLPKNTNKPSSGPEAFSVTNPNAFLKSVSDEYGITKKVDKEGKILTENILSKIGENSDRPSSRYFAKFLKSINDSLPNFSFTVDNNSGSAGSYGTGFTKEGKDGEIKTTNELVMNLSAFKSKLPRQGKSIFRKELFEETLLHELVHGHLAAYTRLAEVDPSKVPSKVMKALNSIEATRQMARRALPETMQNHLAAVDGMDYRKFNVYKRENNLNNREQRILYAFANIDSVNASSKGKFSHEYIVHVMTNPTVQAYLNTVEFEGSKSVFDRLVQVISDFLKAIGESLGVDIKKDSLLEEAVKNGFEVLTQTSTLGQGSITQADLDWNENTKYFGYNNANVVNSDILLTEKGKSILANQELRDIRKSFGLLKRDGKPKQLTSNQAKAKVKNLKTTNERFVKEYGSMYEPYVVFTPSSDKAYYNVGFRVKERSVPVQGVLFNHNVGFDNDSTVDPSIKKIIERIESRIRNIKKSMSKSKSDKVTFQEQIDKLENEIEKLTEENSLNSLAEVANEHLKWGEDVLNQEFVGVKELKDIENLINVWRDVKKIFKSDYSGKFKKVIGDISNRAEDLEVKFMDVNKALMLKEINNTGVEQTILDDLEVMKDSKVARSKLHDLSESGTNAASRSLDTWLKNAARDSGFEFLKFTKKMENMTKLLKSTEEFKRNKFNIFHQIKDGKWTGGLTNRYSLEYDIEYNAQLRKRDRKKGDPESWKNFFKWEKKNKIMIDTRLLFEEDGSRKSDNMFKKHVKELQDEFGEKRAEEMISQAEEKYMDYLSDRQSYIESLEARKEIQDDFNEEQYEAELKRWTLENSPKSYISSYFGQAIIKGIKMRGYKYTVSKPRKIIDGQDSGWYDKKYEQIENNPTLKEFYDFYKDTMAESLSHLPTYEIKDLKDNFIPNVKRSLVQRWTDGKMKGALSGVYEEIVNQISTSEKGAVSADRDMRTGRLNQRIPVRFLQDMDPEEKSTDMIKGLELFHMMALNYKHKSKIEDKVLLLQRIINEAVEQKVTAASQDQRDTSGSLYQVTDGMVNLKSAVQDTIDAMLYDKRRNEGAPTGLVIAKTLKDTVEASKLAKQIKMLNKDFELGKIDNIEHSKQTEPLQKRLDEIGGRNITTADVADTTMMITQLKGMAYNIFSAANNISFGLVGNIMHAAGGEDFSIKQSLKAYRMMLNATGKSIGLDRTGFGASAAKKILALMEIFDVMGEVNESKHKSAIASKKRTMLSKLSPYELQRRSEYFVQGQNMIAMMLNKKVTRLDGKETSLFEAFDENGQWKVAEYGADNQWDGDISSDKEMKSFRKFRNHLLQLNKRIHGNYDPNSFVPAKKAIFGRFALQFRSWFAEAVAMRFEPERPDAQLGRNVKGMYRTIGQIGPMKTMSAYLKIAMMSKNGLDEFSDVDKANLKKSFTELSFVIGVTIAGMLLSQLGDDDDDDKRVRNVLINQLYRLQSDLTFFMSPSSFDRILSNPVPAIRTYLDAEKALKAVGQYVMQDSELDGRKKLSGEEAMMKFLKAFPFLNQIPKAKTQSEKVLK